nr:MAG TPA: hypothetical protein [Caudoviricetes sp.]
MRIFQCVQNILIKKSTSFKKTLKKDLTYNAGVI